MTDAGLTQLPPAKPGGLRAVFADQGLLLTNAGAMAAGTLATAVLGFFYWLLAARLFPPEVVGFASGAISLMMLLAHVGEFGLGPFLIGAVARKPETAGGLISASLISAAGLSLITGVLALVLLDRMGLAIGDRAGSFAAALLVLAGIVATGFTLVLDQACVALLRPFLQMIRNIVFGATKLALLLALALYAASAVSELAILGTWLVGQAVSLVALVGYVAWRGQPVWRRPRVALLRPVIGEVWDHHVLNVVLQAPTLAFPFLVTVVISAEVNAAFYAGWTLINVILLVPASLSTAVYSTGAHQPAMVAKRLRLSLGLSALGGLGAGLLFYGFSDALIAIFNPRYAQIASGGMTWLGFAVLAVAVKYHYVAIQRLHNRMSQASRMMALAAMLEFAAAALGGHLGGLAGLVDAWVLATFAQAAFLSPLLLRHAFPDLDDRDEASR